MILLVIIHIFTCIVLIVIDNILPSVCNIIIIINTNVLVSLSSIPFRACLYLYKQYMYLYASMYNFARQQSTINRNRADLSDSDNKLLHVIL